MKPLPCQSVRGQAKTTWNITRGSTAKHLDIVSQKGDAGETSPEKLMDALTAVGCDVDIVVRPSRSPGDGALRVAGAR